VANIKEILAQNLKDHRKRLGITQSLLAEKAGMSTQYLGMIEIARNFPTADVLERLAAALGIKANELFSVADSPEIAMEQLQMAILGKIDQKLVDFDQVIKRAVKEAIAENADKMSGPRVAGS
jgi:transcriptional regulator with XRE-family HTH domain